jgi:hypothetical protein
MTPIYKTVKDTKKLGAVMHPVLKFHQDWENLVFAVACKVSIFTD